MTILGIVIGVMGILAVLGVIGALLGLCAKLLPAIFTTGIVAVILMALLSNVEVQNYLHELGFYLS